MCHARYASVTTRRDAKTRLGLFLRNGYDGCLASVQLGNVTTFVYTLRQCQKARVLGDNSVPLQVLAHELRLESSESSEA